jgi:phenylacetate-coenzyme A ligase PaaK-like adenylate-forming protein
VREEAVRLARDVARALPRRLGVADVEPSRLAPLLLLQTSPEGRAEGLGEALTDKLVDLTVAQARAGSSFYADLYSHLAPDEYVDVAALGGLPLIDRQEIIRAGPSAINSRYATYSFSTYTSGTTTGLPLIVDRCEQEERYLFDLIGRIVSPRAADATIALVVSSVHHGRQLAIPSRTRAVPVSLSNAVGFVQARRLLERTFPIGAGEESITALAGPAARLQQLTVWLSDEGAHGAAAHVRSVQTTSNYLTKHARDTLESFWGCRVIDRFSLAELFAGAAECHLCGWYHFDPFAVPEVLELGTGRRLENGRGLLVLTGLYPFTQMTPLIRYQPGDLVELRSEVCPVGSQGFRFLGRAGTCLSLEEISGPGAFLAGGDLYEVLDPLPEVERAIDPSAVPDACKPVGSLPRFAFSRHTGGVRIEVGASFSPGAFRDRARRLRLDIEAGIREWLPWLDEPLTTGRLAVDIVPPGTLKGGAPYRP